MNSPLVQDSTPVAGFLNLAKPRGPTSHDVVARVRRATRIRRVGHAGTLDPLAEGVLVLAVGRATRLIEYVASGEKVYRATIRLGGTTTTDDEEGALTQTRPITVGLADIEAALLRFPGEIEQRPPMFSAVHVDGRRAYDLARQGADVELPVRHVQIASITVLDWQAPDLTLEVVCGPGTYIRSLARDLGEMLGCGAHLAGLIRTRSGRFSLDTAASMADLEHCAGRYTLPALLVSPGDALTHLPSLIVTPQGCTLLRQGQPVSSRCHLSSVPAGARANSPVCALDPEGRLIAVAKYDPEQDCWRPRKVVG